MSILDIALAAYKRGIYVIPPREDGTKAPLAESSAGQARWARRPDEAKLRAWYGPRHGLGFATGSASNHLELFEFDDEATYEEFTQAARSIGLGPLVERIEAGYCERTPGGGIHWLWFCQPALPSTKLARRRDEAGNIHVLIETKGEGGYVVVAPSNGRVHASGRAYELLRGGVESIATVSPEERQQLFELARAFDELPERGAITEAVVPRNLDPGLPGNDFANRTSWHELLEPHGWRAVYSRGEVTYWRRPGKNAGISASTNWGGYELLWVWSTSTPFEAERGYNKFYAYAVLEHEGDFRAAARQLAAEGYGQAPRLVVGSKTREGTPATAAGYLPELAIETAPVDGWLAEYCDYASRVSPMTPRHFHQTAGLWLIAVAIARRLCIQMPFATIYPNIWSLWLAPTTLYRKSTALNVARSLAKRAFPHLLMPQEMTAEGFLSDMAGFEPTNLEKLTEEQKRRWLRGRDYAAQKGLVIDEASGLLAGAGRDYNAGLIEALLRFYDCDEEYTRTTRGQGLVMIRNASLSILGASTPAAMAAHLLSDRLWAMGWWPRFGIVTPADERPEWQEPVDCEEPRHLVTQLQRLYERLPASQWIKPAGALFAGMDEHALAEWAAYNKWASYDSLNDCLDHRLYGTYGRLPTHVLKVAMLLTAIEWPEGDAYPYVETTHLRQAIGIVEQWRLGAHSALATATRSEDEAAIQRVRRAISKAGPRGLTMRDLGRALRDMRSSSLLLAVDQLIRLGEVERVQQTREGAGRRSEILKMVTE